MDVKDYKTHIVAIIAIVASLTLINIFDEEIAKFALGVWIGLLILPLLALLVNILFIKQLSDKPSEPTSPYFFTAIEPGRIKAVLRGGKIVRYLMNYAGYRFSREGDDETQDIHWDVVDGDDKVPLIAIQRFNLAEFVLWPFFAKQVFGWYVSVIHRATGHVFVGIWPFQVLHMYKFSRKVQKLDSDGKALTNAEGSPILEERIESTDHVRARVFVWNVEGQAGETREGLQVFVRGIANVHTTNPQKSLFGSDRWDVVLTSSILRTLASTMRTMPIDEVLTATEENKDKLARTVKDIANERLAKYGLQIDDYQIVDFEAQLSPEDSKALTAKWRAEKLKEAERIQGEGRGEGRAAEINAVSKAIREGGEEARRVQELEALIRQASEAGKSGGVVIIGGQNSDSGVNAAILAELKKLNK